MYQEYLVHGQSLTDIADEVRELSGATGTMSLATMKTNLDNANSEVTLQSDLLEQALVALACKASNGLPDGISAIATGTLTPTSDISGYYYINYNIDFTPNFALVVADCDPFVHGDYNGYLLMESRTAMSVTMNGKVYNYIMATTWGNASTSSSTLTTLPGLSTRDSVASSTQLFIDTAYAKLKAGTTYRWIVGRRDD